MSKIPVEKDDFYLELRDDLFDQLSEVRNLTTYNLFDSEDRKIFVINHLRLEDFGLN